MQNQSNNETSQSGDFPRVIMVRIRSVMEKNDIAMIQIRTDSTVRELRMACHFCMGPKAESQSLLFDGKELKDDDKILAYYGLTGDCVVNMAPRMSSGTSALRQPNSEVIFIVPNIIPSSVQTMSDLRETIRGMHTSLPSKLAKTVNPPDRKAHMWTPEKQMEHEVTRNRMKELMQRRKKSRKSPTKSTEFNEAQHSSAPEETKGAHSPISNTLSIRDTGSICGSVGRSPMGSEPGTPPELKSLKKSPASISSSTNVEPKDPALIPITEKELKLYFTAPETHRQAEMARRDLYKPPQNREELQKIKQELLELRKSTCGVCKRHLPLIHQSLKCRCGQVFCPKHRNAEQHKCNVDYKLAGRKKLEKEVPKLELGGARKAKLDD